MASPTAIALVTVGAASGLVGFVLSIVNQKRLRHTVTWLKKERHAEWEALPWITRTLHPISAVSRLNQRLEHDPEFAHHYGIVMRARPPMVAALGVSLGTIVIALIGSLTGLWEL